MGAKRFVSGVVREGKRVRWPKREVLIPAIVTVIVIAIFTGLFLWLEDWAGNSLLEILRNAFNGLGGGGGSSSAV